VSGKAAVYLVVLNTIGRVFCALCVVNYMGLLWYLPMNPELHKST